MKLSIFFILLCAGFFVYSPVYAECTSKWTIEPAVQDLIKRQGLYYLPIEIRAKSTPKECLRFLTFDTNDTISFRSGANSFEAKLLNQQLNSLNRWKDKKIIPINSDSARLLLQVPSPYEITPAQYKAFLMFEAYTDEERKILLGADRGQGISLSVPPLASVYLRGHAQSGSFATHTIDFGYLYKGSSQEVAMTVQSNTMTNMTLESRNGALVNVENKNYRVHYEVKIGTNIFRPTSSRPEMIMENVTNSGRHFIGMKVTIIEETTKLLSGQYNDELIVTIGPKL